MRKTNKIIKPITTKKTKPIISTKTKKRKITTIKQINNHNTTPNNITQWLNKGYPYAKYFINPKKLIHKLRTYSPRISYEKFNYLYKSEVPELKDHRFNNKYVSIFIPMNIYNKLDIIVDYYTEESRLKCTLKNKPSPYDLATKKNLLEYTLNKLNQKNIPITYESYRDEIYNYPGLYICSGESVLFYKGLIRVLFGNKYNLSNLNIMDGAIGYGQRLMTALVLKCNYIGIDPNIETIQACINMINDNGTPAKTQHAYPEGLPASEHINNTPNNSQDIVFFSPPSFDEEIYGSHEQQSILLFPTFDVWINGFLYPSLDILVSKIKVNGYLIVQSRKIKYIYSYLMKKLELKFKGVIARKTYGNKYKPNHIFQKINIKKY